MSNKNNKNEMSEEDYLKRHLNDIDGSKKKSPFDSNSDIPFVQPQVETNKVSDMQYFNFDVRELPCGQFYPTGTLFMVRPAQVKEIQAYSMVDDNNFYDIVEKMNDMMQACVRIKYPDGRIGSYLEIKDQDRLFLIFMIRELTFQQGNYLATKKNCTCGAETSLELKRGNFDYYSIDDKLDRFFNLSTKSFFFTIYSSKEKGFSG